MATITSVLDTLLPQVLGRAGDAQRASARLLQAPLSGVLAVKPAPDAGRHNDGRLAAAGGRGRVTAAGAARPGTDPVTTDPARASAPGHPHGHAARSASTRAHLSGAARAIAALSDAHESRLAGVATARGALVAAGARPSVAALAAALGRQVGESGAFYEFHLLQWLQGKRAHRLLLAEPQARLGARGPAAATDAFSAAWDRPAQSSAPRGALADGAGPRAPTQAAGSHTGGGPGAASGDAAIDPRLASIVRQQLNLLAGAAFDWHGQAWPGAPMRWRVEQRDDRGDRQPPLPQDQRCYTTSLNLELPRLGRLELQLTLACDAVHIRAFAGEPQCAAALRAGRTELGDRLARAGFGRALVEVADARAPR